MGTWRPPRNRTQRSMQAIRSMQNGTIDGLMGGASPVRSDPSDDTLVDIATGDDTSAGAGTISDTLVAWVDYFTATKSGAQTFILSKIPWYGSDLIAAYRQYPTVHVYWNGVHQKDTTSYSLNNQKLTVSDIGGWLRPGDIITVKYLYDPDAQAVQNEVTYSMEYWLETYTPTNNNSSPNVMFYGAATAPIQGTNGGVLTSYATIYVNLRQGTQWSGRFRRPAGMGIIPTDPTVVKDIWWEASFDVRADMKIPYVDYSYTGTTPGSVWCDANCRWAGAGHDTCTNFPTGPRPLSSGSYTISPAPGPETGIRFAEDTDAVSLAQFMNAGNSAPVQFAHDTPVGTWNDVTLMETTCGPSGAPYGWANDTIYGFKTGHKIAFDMTVGITCHVIPVDGVTL